MTAAHFPATRCGAANVAVKSAIGGQDQPIASPANHVGSTAAISGQ